MKGGVPPPFTLSGDRIGCGSPEPPRNTQVPLGVPSSGRIACGHREESRAGPLRHDTVARLLGLPEEWKLCWEEKPPPPGGYAALSEPLLLLLPASSMGSGDLHPPRPSITPLSASRRGQIAIATPFTTAWRWRTSALGALVLMVTCCPHHFADC